MKKVVLKAEQLSKSFSSDYIRRYGDFKAKPGRAGCVSAQALWVCISADLFDGWNVGDGQCAFGRAFAAKG